MEQELKQEISEQGLETEGGEQEQQADDTQRLELEQKARESGWVPKEEFRGDLRRWRDAESWVKHADQYLPIARATNRRLEEKTAALEQELATTRDTLRAITQMQDKYSGDFYEAKAGEIEAAINEAVSNRDVDQVKTLRAQLAKLTKPEPVSKPAETDNNQPQSIHPAIAQWKAENQWFDADLLNPKGDDVMTAYAMRVGAILQAQKDPVSAPGQEEAFCRKVTEMVKAKFPEKFSNPNRQRGGIDETSLRGGSESGVAGNRRTWNDLPQEAKDYFSNVFKRDWPNATREEYVGKYPW